MRDFKQMEKDIQTKIKSCIIAREKYNDENTSKDDKYFIKSDGQMFLDYYAWPGGYPLFYVTKDSGVLCPKCANDNLELLSDEYDPQWYVIGCDINYEDDSLYCDHCNEQIVSAYGDDIDEE